MYYVVCRFSLNLTPLLSLPIFWHPQSRMGCQEIERDRNENKTKKMRMAWTAVHKSCKIWDYLTRLRSLMSWSGRTNLLNYYLFLCSLVGVAGCAGWPGQWRGPGGVWVQGVRQGVHEELPLQPRCLAPAGPTGTPIWVEWYSNFEYREYGREFIKSSCCRPDV